MNCAAIDEKLLSLTASGGVPELTAEERAHVRACPRCAALAAEITAASGRIASASSAGIPGPEYWSSILPRVRERTARNVTAAGHPVFSALARGFMPAAAAVVIALLVSVAGIDPPGRTAGDGTVASLSDDELVELRQSGKYTGLLEPAESNGAGENGVSDLLAELFSEKGEEALSVIAEPEELLREVDEAQFTEIVSLLENR